jgi:hypothetical protein
MKWIKATEILDILSKKEDKLLTFKSGTMNFTGWYYPEDNNFQDVLNGTFPIEDIYVLDESPSPSPVGRSVQELAEKWAEENYCNDREALSPIEKEKYDKVVDAYKKGWLQSSIPVKKDMNAESYLEGLLGRFKPFLIQGHIDWTENLKSQIKNYAAIAGASVSLPSPIPVSIVEQLEKANPYGESTSNRSMGKSLGWEECLSKLRELIAAQPEIEYKITPDILEKMKEKADVWNDEIKPHILRGIGIGFLMAINHFKLNTAPQPAAVPDVNVLTDALEKVSKYGSSNSDAIEDWAEMRTIASVALSQFNTSKQSGTGNYISLSAAVNEFLSTIPLDNGNNYLPGFGIALDRVRQALPASKQHKEDKV